MDTVINQGGSIEERLEESITLRALQQQFEKMNIICDEIRVCLDRRDIVIVNLQRGRQQRHYNKKGSIARTPIGRTFFPRYRFINSKDKSLVVAKQ